MRKVCQQHFNCECSLCKYVSGGKSGVWIIIVIIIIIIIIIIIMIIVIIIKTIFFYNNINNK